MSDLEIEELDDFLAGEVREETSMDVSSLEGFLVAVVMGPRLVLPSEWLPWIWDMQEGESEAEFANKEQANRIISLIMRYYNGVNRTFEIDPVSFEPIFCGVARNGVLPNGARGLFLDTSLTITNGVHWRMNIRNGSRHLRT